MRQQYPAVKLRGGLGVTFLPPGEQVSGGGVLVMFRGLEPQLEGEEPRILIEKTAAVRHARPHLAAQSYHRLGAFLKPL